MDIIGSVFAACRDSGRTVFIAYVTAGDPDFATSVKIVEALTEAGVDIIELGLPFSDPLADGEANQLAAARALNAGITPSKVLELACGIRKTNPGLPLVLFTYMNPVSYSSSADFANFCMQAVDSGINAILPLDLPPEELDDKCSPGLSYREAMEKAGLPNVSLIAPNTPRERYPLLTSSASSFIYYVSKEGVTGEGATFSAGFADRISAIREVTQLPIVVGFGISTPEHVRSACSTRVDGVVVGSAIVRRIQSLAEGKESIEGIKSFVASLAKETRIP
ncbi:MAG: tryptophan synthase subunit alpha [Victivallales bacterium]|nr:tryptophan synthase subunit alpha [Victivallales bacterium]